MNTVNVVGKISSDPMKSTSSNGVQFAKFKLAVEKANKDGNANGYDIFEIVVFRELADLDYKVGHYAAITGKLTSNNYEKDDKQYYNCQIVGTSVLLMGK